MSSFWITPIAKKAASTAINLIFRYPEYVQSAPTFRTCGEELAHFELLLTHLEARKIPYAARAKSICRKVDVHRAVWRAHRLVDVLLCCGAIEARSCERMKVLADNLADPVLAKLYRGLLASEARHHSIYVVS